MIGWAMEPARLRDTAVLAFDLTYQFTKMGRDLLNAVGVDHENKIFIGAQIFCWRKTLDYLQCCTTQLLPRPWDPASTRQVELTVADGDDQLQRALCYARDLGVLLSPGCKCRHCSLHHVHKPLREVLNDETHLSINDRRLVKSVFRRLVHTVESRQEASLLWRCLKAFLRRKRVTGGLRKEVARLEGSRDLYENHHFMKVRHHGIRTSNPAEISFSLLVRTCTGGLGLKDAQSDKAVLEIKDHADAARVERILRAHRVQCSRRKFPPKQQFLEVLIPRMSIEGHALLRKQVFRYEHAGYQVWRKPGTLTFYVRRTKRVRMPAFTTAEKRRAARSQGPVRGQAGPSVIHVRMVCICVDARGSLTLLCTCLLWVQSRELCGHVLSIKNGLVDPDKDINTFWLLGDRKDDDWQGTTLHGVDAEVKQLASEHLAQGRIPSVSSLLKNSSWPWDALEKARTSVPRSL